MTLGFSEKFDIAKGVESDGMDDNFIPSGTVIKVETDGSGDFTSIEDAVNSLNGKWSSGAVTIQLGEGTFNVSSVINIHGDLFNIPKLTIRGSGTTNTIILADNVPAFSGVFEVRRAFAVITALTIKRTASASDSIGVAVFSFGKTLVSDVNIENMMFPLRALNNGEMEIGGNVSLKTSTYAIESGGGCIHSYYATINVNSATTAFRVFDGGTIKDVGSSITYTSVTNKTNQTVGTATNNGWITGVTV